MDQDSDHNAHLVLIKTAMPSIIHAKQFMKKNLSITGKLASVSQIFLLQRADTNDDCLI